jgi:hypothetical protein
MEDEKDQKDQKIHASTPNPPDPVYAIDQWREALQEIPEWDSLPDGFHAAILRRLKSTNYPTEPSGHTSWKHVKMMLRQGKQPDWINLTTATFIWRVKRQRPDMKPITALPDTFVSEAAFHNPPINITNWPTKGMTAALQPKQELIPQSGVKAEDSAQNTPGPALWAPKAPAAREGTVAGEATVAPEPSAAPSTGLVPPTISGSTGQKRAQPADQENTTDRSQKRQNIASGSGVEAAVDTDDLNDWKKKWADSEDKLADLSRELTDTKNDLADNAQKLADTTKKLENTTMELGELRAIALSNRRYIRRIVGGMAARARSLEQLLSQMLQDHEGLMESMG